MTAIAATSSAIAQSSPIVQAATTTSAAPTASSAPATSAQSPAVVISLSPGTLSALSHPADTTAEQRVNSLVEEVKTHNDIADAWAHVDWTVFAKIGGETKANALKAEASKYLDYSAARIGREFGESGIDVRPATSTQVAATGVAPGTLLVKDFSFQAGGSTYAVTAREDGTLVGTRDGQAWKTWKTVPAQTTATSGGNGTAAALMTLQGLLSPGTGSGPGALLNRAT